EVILEGLREEDCVLEASALRPLLDGLATAEAEALRRYAMERERMLRASEAELRQSEMRYRLATLATSDVIWDWDIRSGLVHWSESISRVTGYSPEVMESPLEWWIERVHPEERERVVRSLHAAAAGGEPHWMAE